MNRSQQRLNSLKIHELKNIRNLNISFEDKNVTAILGPNGNGKSTILHALACVYKPQNIGENYRFSSFFLPSTDALWNDSHFEINHFYRQGKDTFSVDRKFQKTQIRWTPRYANRPERDCFFMGIDSCVPMIEKETRHARINYDTEEITISTVNRILEKASYILNKRYETLNSHNSGNKSFIGVVSEGIQYSAISMSASEQKVFAILEKLFNANNYSILLIDELDLLLHDMAFKRLINVIIEYANDKNIQVIFTTHRESVTDFEKEINIRHIVKKGENTLCFNETKPAAIDRLTGEQSKPLEFFVEDDLSQAIIRKLSTEEKIGKYISITKYGACINAFSIAAGLLYGNNDCDKVKIIIDGDEYKTSSEIERRINNVITGTDQTSIDYREKAKELITKYNLPDNLRPEPYIHSVIKSMPDTDNPEFNEIIEVANEIGIVNDSHKYIDDIIFTMGWEKNVGLAKIVDLFRTSSKWEEFTEFIRHWVKEQAEQIRENHLITR